MHVASQVTEISDQDQKFKIIPRIFFLFQIWWLVKVSTILFEKDSTLKRSVSIMFGKQHCCPGHFIILAC